MKRKNTEQLDQDDKVIKKTKLDLDNNSLVNEVFREAGIDHSNSLVNGLIRETDIDDSNSLVNEVFREAGIDDFGKEINDETLRQESISEKYENIKRILESSPNINHLLRGSISIVMIFINTIDRTDNENKKNEQNDILELLLSRNPDLNFTNIDGDTALMLATKRGLTEVVRILLNNGAEVSIDEKNGWGINPLIHARVSDNKDIFEMLLLAGADNEAGVDNDFYLKFMVEISSTSSMPPSNLYNVISSMPPSDLYSIISAISPNLQNIMLAISPNLYDIMSHTSLDLCNMISDIPPSDLQNLLLAVGSISDLGTNSDSEGNSSSEYNSDSETNSGSEGNPDSEGNSNDECESKSSGCHEDFFFDDIASNT